MTIALKKIRRTTTMSFQPVKLLDTKRPFTPREQRPKKSSAVERLRSSWDKLPEVSEAAVRSANKNAGVGKDCQLVKLPSIDKKIVRKQFRQNAKSSTTCTKSNTKAAEEDQFQTLLKKLKDHHSSENSSGLLRTLEDFQKYIQNSSYIEAWQTRTLIEAILPVLASSSPEVLAAAMEVFLAFNISSLTFPLAAKVFFHLANDDKNDDLLLSGNALDKFVNLLGKAEASVDHEAMHYALGAFRFLTYNPKVIKRLNNGHFMEQLLNLLDQMTSTEFKEENKVFMSNVVFQGTSVLRNLINCKDCKVAFSKGIGDKVLVAIADIYIENVEIMCNVSRIYSALSVDVLKYQSTLLSQMTVDSIFFMMSKHADNPDLVVRASFALGNFAASGDRTRKLVFLNQDCLGLIPSLLEFYVSNPENSISDVEKREDTAVKLIRVLANLTITQEIGETIAMNGSVVKSLLKTLETASDSSFVLLPALSATCNFSFYPCIFMSDIYLKVKDFVFYEDLEVRTEAARVLGNLSRSSEIRSMMQKAFPWSEFYAELKKYKNPDLTYSSLGVLVNMMTEVEFKDKFVGDNGIDFCVAILRDNNHTWDVKTLVCQLLWNFFNGLHNLENMIGHVRFRETTDALMELVDSLSDLHDPDLDLADIEDGDDDEINENLDAKREFLAVAVNLLSRVIQIE